jgi:hypothetical protein
MVSGAIRPSEQNEQGCLFLTCQSRRFASEGLTIWQVQVGGGQAACEEHVHAVKCHTVFKQKEIDFKLSEYEGPRNEACKVDAAFDKLRVRQVRLAPVAAFVRLVFQAALIANCNCSATSW